LFLYNLQNRPNLAISYDAISKLILDAYFLDCIDHYQCTVHYYVRQLDNTIGYRQNIPPGLSQGFNKALDGLPRFVYLIRYSNLSIFNQLRPSMIYINLQSILVMTK
jgi:hypothetical protein